MRRITGRTLALIMLAMAALVVRAQYSRSPAHGLPSGPVVAMLPCGPAAGLYEPPYDGSAAVAAFRGLRYGAPPARWQPPQRAACWPAHTTYNATALRGYCVQPYGDGDEDCLFIHALVNALICID